MSSFIKKLYPLSAVEQDLLLPVTGNPDGLVGRTAIRNPRTGANILVFYPAAPIDSASNFRRAPLFRKGLPFFAGGFVHIMTALFVRPFLVSLVNCILYPFFYFAPLNFQSLPRTYIDVPPLQKHTSLPVIVWSHGLTGSGCEHGLLAVTLCLKGYVVVFPHHSDGSSAVCDIAADTNTKGKEITKNLFYQHPDFSNYDHDLRQKQAESRAREVEDARLLVLTGKCSILKDVVSLRSKVIVGGFSFGGATAGVVAATSPDDYEACILLDGWYHIEFPKYDILIDLPSQLHAKGQGIKNLPTLFVGSQEFDDSEILKKATTTVQSNVTNREIHVLEGTRHGNYSDAVFWVPSFVSQRIGVAGRSVDPQRSFKRFLELVVAFVDRNIEGGEAPKS
jgi:pimeloyl-ACP methyl ester carboxylesterase